MDSSGLPPAASMENIAHEAVTTVERWLSVTDAPAPAVESKLARLLADDDGAQFAIDFVDLVMRPDDLAVASKNFERVSREYPLNVNWLEGAGTHLTGGFAPLMPAAIVPAARERFLKSVGHLLLRGSSADIDKHLAGITEVGGIRPTVAPLTAVASGDRERQRQVDDLNEILRLPNVDSVSTRPAAFLGRPRLIDLEAEVASAVKLLTPLYDTAAQAVPRQFINLDIALHEELEVTLRVFERMMALHPQLDMGISLPACLPESLSALVRIIDRAQKRRAAGGAAVTVRFTRGEQFAHERAEAHKNGWTPAPFATRADTDAHYLRLLNHVLTPERTDAVTVISATHNLFTVAYAWRLARARGVERSLQHEFMLGVATAQMEAVKRDVGGIRLFAPVVQAGNLSLAAPYLKRRLSDLSRGGGHLATMSTRGEKKGFASERDSFLASIECSASLPVATYRTQSSLRSEVADFSVEATREWASAVLERTPDSASGEALLARSRIGTELELDEAVTSAMAHGGSWGERRGSTRATVLESVAEVFAEWRGLLVETMVSESAMTLPEADTDVTAAIELARRSAVTARELDLIHDATYSPPQLVVVVCPRTAPITMLASGVLSALGAGSPVIIKTAPETRRSSAVFVESLTAGGVPPGLVTILEDEEALAEALLSDPRVDHILHAGSRHAAKVFHSWRAESRISSTTGGRNSVIVTPSAHLEAAIDDIVASALDHAGQSLTAVSTVIVVGSVAESARFLGRLTDAIASVPVAAPIATASATSALSRPATASQRLTLETLDEGETWRVQPRQVDALGRWWAPGLRDKVSSEAAFCKAENRAPVLGIVRARTLAEAIDIQNSQGFGLSAGIHSLDQHEIDTWLDAVEAGLLSVNCATCSDSRGRAPVQGWNRSTVGTVNAGGFDAVVSLGQWRAVPIEPGTTVTLKGMSEPVARLITAAQSGIDFAGFDWARAGAMSDERSWHSDYATKEIVQSEYERIEHKHLPVAVTVRLSEGASMTQLVRVLAAAAITRSAIAISTAMPLHADLIDMFHQYDSPVAVAEVLVESDVRWHARVQAGDIATTRIRLLGGDRDVLARVLHGQLGVAVYANPVTTSGRVELLPFLQGQTICTNVQP